MDWNWVLKLFAFTATLVSRMKDIFTILNNYGFIGFGRIHSSRHFLMRWIYSENELTENLNYICNNHSDVTNSVQYLEIVRTVDRLDYGLKNKVDFYSKILEIHFGGSEEQESQRRANKL